MEYTECGNFRFYDNFDSANLAKVVYIPPSESPISITTVAGKNVPEIPNAEFNIWTTPDCCGTEFENGNRTWFYFGLKCPEAGLLVRFNIVDLNRQGKMYSQGMAPVFRTVPGKSNWERIRDKPTHNTVDEIFTVSFKFKTPDNIDSITYFAFTYPFSYMDLQKMLSNIDLKYQALLNCTAEDDIYYQKEVVCYSLEGRDVNLITISSYYGITADREAQLDNLFPEMRKRPHKFQGKKLIFISARVHPGETPSTFVFNGLLNLLLSRDDPVAIMLRRLYVFKMIPFLNPDGVARGHYRTDTRGINLNRVYLNPTITEHPSVFAARNLICYYHTGCAHFEVRRSEHPADIVPSDGNIDAKVSNMTLDESSSREIWCEKCDYCKSLRSGDEQDEEESDLFLYVDMHGHASKKGIFMYGNHFEDNERHVECMLLPKLMSLNNHNFHFTACNFTERNMYLRDRRDGMSREGSGRVSVLRLTGLTKSYTLECNYNTGRLVNVLPPTIREPHCKVHTLPIPPKYTPTIFEEVGKSLAAAILDLTSQNPCTRLSHSEFHSLSGLKEFLRFNSGHADSKKAIASKLNNRKMSGLHNQGKPVAKPRQGAIVPPKRRAKPVPVERKENVAEAEAARNEPGCSAAGERGAAASASAGRLKRSAAALKPRAKKELAPKVKRVGSNSGEKQRARAARPVKANLSALKVRASKEQAKVREIEFAAGAEGFEQVGGDCVALPWELDGAGKLLARKGGKSELESGSDVAKPQYYVHTFGKMSTYAKNRFKKHSLRRLTSAADAGKVEKVKKRKKLKTK